MMSSLSDIARQHLHIYENLFKEMNIRGKEKIPAQEAAAFLKRSNLNVNTLGQIWELADYNREGCLDKRGAFIAFKLIAASQQGICVDADNYLSVLSNDLINAPLFTSRSTTPSLSLSLGTLLLSSSQPSQSQSSSSSITTTTTTTKWSIGQDDQAKYDSIFDALQPVDDKLSGDKVRPVLINSGLPGASLAKIWELSDIDKDGKLDRIEMSIALHLVYCTLQGEQIPAVLPPSLMHPSKIKHKCSLANTTMPTLKQQWYGHRSRTASVTSLNNTSLSSSSSTIQSSMMNSGEVTTRSQSVQPQLINTTPTPTIPLAPLSSASVASPSTVWPVDLALYEGQFRKADSNMDGLVNGNDIKDELIASGLTQSTLAHLWNLADIKHNGTLNIEQFALIMYLIEECKKGKTIPMQLSTNLIPPSLRQQQQQFNQTSLSNTTTHTITPTMQELTTSSSSSGNEELDKLCEEVQKLVVERREADQAIVQLEADMTVKNSEIKNLQIELTTLENTVTQLERQKAEAERRLEALDNQIAHLETIGLQLKRKLDEEEERLSALRIENIRCKENAQKENEELMEAQQQLAVLEENQKHLDATLAQHNAIIESSAIQLTKLESEVKNMEEKKKYLEMENEKLIKSIGTNKGVINQLNTSTTTTIIRPFGNVDPFVDTIQHHHHPAATATAVDDPFVGKDPFANSTSLSSFANFGEPFAASNMHIQGDGDDDPFAIAAAGGGDNYTNTSTNTNTSTSNTTTTTTAKPPPPRPAPPKTRAQIAIQQQQQQHPTTTTTGTITTGTTASITTTEPVDPFAQLTDPFAAATPSSQSNSTTNSDAQFANFANFDAFAS